MFDFLTKNIRAILVKEQRQEHSALFYIICNYIIGFILAWLMWQLLLSNFLIFVRADLLTIAALLIIASGFVFNTGVKCVILLIFVAIVGKSGRGYLRALCFALVISGPIENLSVNGEEVMRIFTCSATLTYNLTKTRLDLMTKPFRNTLPRIKNDMQEIHQSFEKMETFLTPMQKEIEGNDDEGSPLKLRLHKDHPRNVLKTLLSSFRGKANNSNDLASQIQKNYTQKLIKRCKQQIELGKKRCQQIFAKAHQNCRQKFPFIIKSVLCWPFRVDFICKLNILGDSDKICDPSDAISNDFGKTYVALNSNRKNLLGNGSNAHVDYYLPTATYSSAVSKMNRTSMEMIEQLKEKKTTFYRTINVMELLLSFLFTRIIISSIAYYRNYKNKIEFDNNYITAYFEHVDERRKLFNKKSILPLKKYERNNVIYLSQYCSRTKEESEEQIFNLLQFSLEMTTVAFFLLFDHVIVSLLQIVRLRSEISYVQEGEHTIQFNIKGTGFVARLFRSTLENFNIHDHVTTYLSNEKCLPEPSELPQSFYVKLLALYAAVILLIYKSTTFLRLRRVVCSLFYYKREKKRILHLYNRLLSNRTKLLEKTLIAVKTNVSHEQIHLQLNLLLMARSRWPNCCNWLKIFKIGRRVCVICGSTEDDEFKICINKNCGMAYCVECWQEFDNKCILCEYN